MCAGYHDNDVYMPQPDPGCCDCDGSGLVSCETCGGTGIDDDGSKCYDCWGTGLASCPSCYGNG